MLIDITREFGEATILMKLVIVLELKVECALYFVETKYFWAILYFYIVSASRMLCTCQYWPLLCDRHAISSVAVSDSLYFRFFNVN
jgi:hypothetical protein